MDYIVGNAAFTNQTTVNPMGLSILFVMGICILLLPRRWAVFPMLVIACFVSSAQRIVVANLDFDFLRILVLFGAFRVLLLKNEYASFRWCRLDAAVLLWGLSSTLFFTLRVSSFPALVNRLGFCFDVIGMYLLFRCLIRDWRDVDRIIKGLIVISIPLCVFFVIENRTGRNLFAVFGGVPEITVIRDGKLRCQGAFSHPILAGCFWAAIMPLLASQWWKSNIDKMWAVSAMFLSLVIILSCASSTPVFSVLCAGLGGMAYYIRKSMRLVRWGAVGILVTLHVAMNAPVWHLISRVSAVGGSTGYHRFNLIDQAINHFGNWALLGCSGVTVASWGVWAGDVTNQYILEGVNGGFVTMCLFVYCIIVAFSEAGKLWRRAPKRSYQLALYWAIGVSLFVHCVNFMGVSYFGQITILWYMLLATIGSLSLPEKKKRSVSTGSSVGDRDGQG